MKVYILTFHRTSNYGAALQAYALFSYLSSEGADVQIIDYDPPNLAYSYHLPKLWERPLLKLPKKLILQGFLTKGKRYMDNFNSKYLRFTQRCITQADIRNLPPCDIYIVGSDQVWNPFITKEDETFFLPLTLEGRKVAYAASAGSKEIPELFWKRVCGYLKDFDGISVREDSLCQFIFDHGFENCKHLLDPVFLIEADEYRKIAVSPVCKQPYILLYEMAMDPILAEIAKELACQHHLQILQCNRMKNRYHIDKLCSPMGPCEFLGLVDGAEYVVTNSFHGLSLSIILGKQFFTCKLAMLGTRIESILKLLGLMDRMVDTVQTVNYKTSINYITVKEHVQIAALESKRFLQSYLQGELLNDKNK